MRSKMTRLLTITLLLLCATGWGQQLNKGFIQTYPDQVAGLGGFVSVGEGGKTWSEKMLASYLSINDHYIFTNTQKDSILARLEQSYIVSTFGPAGLNKTVCDFFLFFQNVNTATNLTTRTNTKTGEILRWNYGGGNIYSQNNLPAHITNGIVTVTSIDGFSGITLFSVYNNSFSGPTFDVEYYMPNVTNLTLALNAFDGAFPPLPSSLTTVSIFNTDMEGPVPDLADIPNAIDVSLYRNYNATGVISNNIKNTAQYFDYLETPITGINATTFSRLLRKFRFEECEVEGVDAVVHNMANYYKSLAPNYPAYDCAISLQGSLNGYLTNGLLNDDYHDLDSLWTKGSKVLTFKANIHPGEFDKGKVVFTFDDPSTQGTHDLALPLFTSKGVTATTYTPVSTIGGHTPVYPDGVTGCNWEELQDLEDAGWVVGSHSFIHANFLTLTQEERAEQISLALDSFANAGFSRPYHFAYPNGGYDSASTVLISNNFVTARIVGAIYGEPVNYFIGTGSNPYLVTSYWFDGADSPTRDVDKGCDLTHFPEFKKRIDYANLHKTALILAAHHVDHQAGRYTVDVDLLDSVITYIQTLDMDIINYDELYRLMHFQHETRTYLANLTTPISFEMQLRLDSLISDIKDSLNVDTLSNVFDYLYVFANETSEAASKNIAKRAHDITLVNSPNFTAKQGYTSNGASSYLNTNYNPYTQGSAFTLTSATFGFYLRTTRALSSTAVSGAATATEAIRIYPERTEDASRFNLNDLTNTTLTVSGSDCKGFNIVARDGNNKYVYKNKTTQAAAVVAPVGIPNLNIYLCSVNASPQYYETSQMSIAFCGKYLTQDNINDIEDCFERYMDGLGTGIIP